MTPDIPDSDPGALPFSTSVGDFLKRWGSRVGSPAGNAEVAAELLGLYREKGLLPGDTDAALFRCCEHRESCWHRAPAARAPLDSGISFPWIGRSYTETRVVLLGMNFDNFGGLGGHYWICEDHIKQMKLGRRGKDGRAFSRNAMLYLRVVLDRLRGIERAEPAQATNEELAPLWDSCAYLQTVKCSPGTPRSNPTNGMRENCPEFLVCSELQILKPSVVLLFGRSDLRDVVRPWAVPESGYGFEEGPSLERNHAQLEGHAFELFSLNHPSSRMRDFEASLQQLARSVTTQPL